MTFIDPIFQELMKDAPAPPSAPPNVYPSTAPPNAYPSLPNSPEASSDVPMTGGLKGLKVSKRHGNYLVNAVALCG